MPSKDPVEQTGTEEGPQRTPTSGTDSETETYNVLPVLDDPKPPRAIRSFAKSKRQRSSSKKRSKKKDLEAVLGTVVVGIVFGTAGFAISPLLGICIIVYALYQASKANEETNDE